MQNRRTTNAMGAGGKGKGKTRSFLVITSWRKLSSECIEGVPLFSSLLSGCGCGGCADWKRFFAVGVIVVALYCFFFHPFWCCFVYVCIIFSVLFVKIADSKFAQQNNHRSLFSQSHRPSERTGFFQFASLKLGWNLRLGACAKATIEAQQHPSKPVLGWPCYTTMEGFQCFQW